MKSHWVVVRNIYVHSVVATVVLSFPNIQPSKIWNGNPNLFFSFPHHILFLLLSPSVASPFRKEEGLEWRSNPVTFVEVGKANGRLHWTLDCRR
jgi:hypothetical protein